MRDYYLPSAFVEALGWVTIAHQQLEFVLNALVAALEKHLSYLATDSSRSLDRSLLLLEEVRRSGVLRPEWSDVVESILTELHGPLNEFTEAAQGMIYTRGGGSLELAIRSLAAESMLLSPPANMTLARLLKLEQDLRSLSYRASGLALRILRTFESGTQKDSQTGNSTLL